MLATTGKFAIAGIAAFLSVAPCLAADGAENSGDIDGNSWKITFPVAGPEGGALEILNPDFSKHLGGTPPFPSELHKYFHKTDEGWVFTSEFTGVTTSSRTNYSRTELREMKGGEHKNWTLAEGGTLECRLKLTQLEGGANKIIFMQIHGHSPESKPLLKCLWEKGHIRLLTKNGEKLKDFKRKQHYTEIALNEWFTCSIQVGEEVLTIQVNGETIETYTAEEVLGFWPEENTYYFKAGNYLQHDDPGTRSSVVFSSVEVSH